MLSKCAVEVPTVGTARETLDARSVPDSAPAPQNGPPVVA